MKTIFRTLLIVIVCCDIISCTRQIPVSKVTAENNQTYKIDFLFEHEGCKVYRFMDRGNTVYFTNCSGDITGIKVDSTEKRTINIIRNDAKK